MPNPAIKTVIMLKLAKNCILQAHFYTFVVECSIQKYFFDTSIVSYSFVTSCPPTPMHINLCLVCLAIHATKASHPGRKSVDAKISIYVLTKIRFKAFFESANILIMLAC